jgi:hypothetical protein
MRRMQRLPSLRSAIGILMLFFMALVPCTVSAQATGGLRGSVLDPSSAVIPGATITLTRGSEVRKTTSGSDGVYTLRDLEPGSYRIAVTAPGFVLPPNAMVAIASGHTRQLNLTLSIAVEQENVQVSGQSSGVSLSPDENSGAIILKGDDLDALSDDPDELQNELQALAGPAAGPNGGQIYIDGFTGGQLPPKSSIREIRVNQNPFSAEFDSIGYGRVEILTKPGSDKFSGHIASLGVDSALNTNNALVPGTPEYHLYFLQSDVTGPLTKHSSYFISIFGMRRQVQNIIDATNPSNVATQLLATNPNPSSILDINPRIDFQAGANNTFSIRDAFHRNAASGNGVGNLNLASQALNAINYENALQISDTIVVNPHLINETHFQWRRIRNNQYAVVTTPTQTVQGTFTTGGNYAGTNTDHQDVMELQNYSTATAGKHTIRFGTRLRSYRDANVTTSGENGQYNFQNTSQYEACLPSPNPGCAPDQYQAVVIRNPLARALVFDAALFYQDDWRIKPGLTFSYGLRYEGQNRIRDHADFAPRLAVAWAPHFDSKKPPKTVLRAGYGWFYTRFTMPGQLGSGTGTPYVIQTIHQNGVNQQSYVINDLQPQPGGYDLDASLPESTLQSYPGSTPAIDTIAPHFHAALNMQGGVGIDRTLWKNTTANVTYLFTRGVHQYFTNVVTAPAFDVGSYTITGPPPTVYNNQFQSGGIFNENQITATFGTHYKKLGINANYAFSDAKSDTSGVTYVPSVAQNPGLDYGRASFSIHNRLFLLATYTAPHGITIAPLLAAQSGTPYNITIGDDLTGNNQYNARPTYGTCGTPDVVSTPFGCLDENPTGKNERMIPYNVGTGPVNAVFHMRVSKSIGIGPHIKTQTGGPNMQAGGGALSGNQQQIKLDASVPRRYNLTFIAGALNVFNIDNRGTPNGTLKSPLFGQSVTLASGPFGMPAPGNRVVFLQALFSF